MANVKQAIILLITLINAFHCNEIRRNCTCLPFHQCQDGENDLNSDGSGLLDVRKLEANQCSGHFDVCCQNATTLPEPTTEAPLELTGCGYQNNGFFPWSAGLVYQTAQKAPLINQCGVALINKKAAITAAHCLDDAEGFIWSIHIGNTLRPIKKLIIHPLYNEATLHNDIAVLILASAVPISKKIGTICIPPRGIVINQTMCNSPTWVEHRTNNKTFSYLAMARLAIVPRERCLKLLRTTRLGPVFQLHHSFICAGDGKNGEKKEPCGRGNGGNALVCPVDGQPGRFHQLGIVSWGIGCGENKIPGVYVKLDVFRDWIDDVMTENGLDIDSYRY